MTHAEQGAMSKEQVEQGQRGLQEIGKNERPAKIETLKVFWSSFEA